MADLVPLFCIALTVVVALWLYVKNQRLRSALEQAIHTSEMRYNIIEKRKETIRRLLEENMMLSDKADKWDRLQRNAAAGRKKARAKA